MAGVIKLESDPRITVLALSWRDIKAPKAGGAEIHTHEMLSRADHKKIRIIHFSPLFDSASPDETIDGVRYLRQGNIFSVISAAHAFYRANRDRIDFVIDQCNTHRFYTILGPAGKTDFLYPSAYKRNLGYSGHISCQHTREASGNADATNESERPCHHYGF